MKGKQEVECELFMKAPVIIEEYNPMWPLLYEDEKNRILKPIMMHDLCLLALGEKTAGK